MASPIEQFEIKPIVALGKVGGADIALTNSGLFMLIVVGFAMAFLGLAATRATLVPGRMQAAAESLYGLVASTLHGAAGKEGMKYFPLVFSLFIFVLFCNLAGMIPGGFTVTSHIIVTFALAMVVFLAVIVIGFAKNGLKFLELFTPHGVPLAVLPIITLIEVVSFLARPVSLSMRLFANMMAGHIALKLFAGFVVSMAGAGVLGFLGAALPLAVVVGLTALEFLVAFIQAYVFTILTCIYLNDALHPSH